MKILLLSSSPRKENSQTLLLAKEVLKGCDTASVKSEIINLHDLKIEFCRHCEACHKKILCCPIEDDVGAVLKNMLEADAIILASPNYINQITASMKAFFDRSSHFIHCKRLTGKYIIGVVCSGSGEDDEILRYMKHYANACGAQYAGGVSSGVPVSDEKKKEGLNLGKMLTAAIKEKKLFPEQLSIIETNKERFKKVMEKRKDDWAEEYQYWKDNGWL
ncbi:MAG: flavodoxin family protein [Candidatus Omnitrophica bacterium]|jgi:multimeric flavodoxin WrbA|nr:flavodoxin family protein [Candidatus Omnitrophota bacterium]